MNWIGLFILGICLISENCVVNSLDMDMVYEACKNGVCFGQPDGCEATKNCEFMAAVKKDNENYKFTVARSASAAETWVGVGLTKNTVKPMANTSIVACFGDTPTEMGVYSVPDHPRNIVELDAQEKDFISSPNGEYKDGKIMCTFTRKASSTVKNNVFDLDKDKYYLLIGIGDNKADGLKIKKHDKGIPRRSKDVYDFSQKSGSSEKDKSFSVRSSESKFLLAVTAAFTFFKLHMQ